MQDEVGLKVQGGAEKLFLAPSSTHLQPPVLTCQLLCMCCHVSYQQGVLCEAAGAVWAGEDWQREVGEGVPQQGTQRELGELTDQAAQALGADVAQDVVSDSLSGSETSCVRHLNM